jgi:hypothetical protein
LPTSHSDPRLSKLCPNPACLGIITQANAYVHEKLAGRLAPDYGPLFGRADYQDLRERLIDALAAGDLDTTKTVCRDWCKLVLRWTATHVAGQAA